MPETANMLYSLMMEAREPEQVPGLARFFRTGPGEYGEGDSFLGIKVPVTSKIVRGCWKETGFAELEECISSEFHEMRLAALLTLVQKFSHAGSDRELQRRCVDFYLAHLRYVNNWDLVDLSCYELLGAWLLDKDRTILHELTCPQRQNHLGEAHRHGQHDEIREERRAGRLLCDRRHLSGESRTSARPAPEGGRVAAP